MSKHSASGVIYGLVVVAALALVIGPVIRLAPIVGYMQARGEMASAGYQYASRFGPVETVGTSPHFSIQAARGYLSQSEVEDLLARMEKKRDILADYLEMPGDDRTVVIRMNVADGIPYTGTKDINIFGYQVGHTSLVHELTHYLMGYPNGLVAEGLAIYTEDRFGWGMSFPNMLRPVQANLYNFLRKGSDLVPLDELGRAGHLYQAADPERSRLRYLECASFTRFMMAQYDKSAVMKVYRTGDYLGVTSKTIDDLEQDWLAWVRRGHLAQTGLMMLGGLAVIGLFHLGRVSGWRWMILAALAFAAFLVWDYYLFYSPMLPVALLAVIALGGLATYFSKRWGLVFTWVAASLVLLWFIVLPLFA